MNNSIELAPALSHNFMGVSTYSPTNQMKSEKKSKAVIVGIPFDCGTDPMRIGARHGPESIRKQSQILDPYLFGFSDINPIEELQLTDFGDLPLTAGKLEEAFEIIEQAITHFASEGIIPLTFGGDGMVSLPQIRALSKFHDDLTVLHFDAHTDAYPIDEERYNTATTFTCAAQEQLIDIRNSYHIGGRGPASQPALAEFAGQLGYNVISTDQLFAEGPLQIIQSIKDKLGNKPVYLCWDMDFFDASCVPGVCEPTWGGPNAREGLSILKALQGLNLVGVDINTVCPPHDHTQMSAHLAANVALISLHLLSQNRLSA